MTKLDAAERGRRSFERRAWADAYSELLSADADSPLGPEDLDRLAATAFLIGRESESHDAWARAHQEFSARGDHARAARAAFWNGFTFMRRGEAAPAGGWFARAQTSLGAGEGEHVELGYLLIPQALQNLFGGAPGPALEIFEQIAAIADGHRDNDLATLSRFGRGQALVGLGRTADGLAMFDEAMVAVTADETSPIVAGIVYCGVIAECQRCFDLRRAREWTIALSHWCETQPDLVLFRGQCQVHRAQLMHLGGEWLDAMDEAQRARDRLAEPPPEPAVGEAYYLVGELQRLRGRLEEAEESYRQANQWGRSPQPGLAQLRLAQGQVDAAANAIRRVVDETHDPVERSRLLPVAVETFLAVEDVEAARASAAELAEIAAVIDAPLLQAVSAHALGSVILAEGDARAALDELRRAWRAWQELDAPYEAARARVSIGLAYRVLGDEDSAEMEFDAARWVFGELGAQPALAQVHALTERDGPTTSDNLTARELEVLRLIAAGSTNRGVADQLVISEKTVARHVSNIFVKIGVSSRAGATAYAYEHGLV